MDCRQIDRLLEANLDGRLSGFERMGLRQHLKTCRTCQAKVDAMTAFSERVEKTLAGAGGPDWRRLAPPPTLRPGAEERAEVRPRVPEPPPRARSVPPASSPNRKPRTSLGIAVAGVALITLVVPFWLPRTPISPAPWLAEAIGAEAARRAAGRAPDLATDDPASAAAWFEAHRLAGMPTLSLPASVTLEGAFLTYYDGGRVAGLVLATPAGPLAVHLRPTPEPLGGPSPAVAAGGELEAFGVAAGAWRAAVVGRPDAIDGSGVAAWAPGLVAEPAGS